MKDISVILPSYKPDEKLLSCVAGLEKAGFEDIIVVDDGGGSDYNRFFDEIRKKPTCTVLVHPENRGKGAALKTAFKWYTENRNGAGVVTADGDGQHFPEDVMAVAQKMKDTGETVLGVRDFTLPDVPWRSRKGNHITSFVFKLFAGIKCSDTQTGLRAFPSEILPTLLKISGDRYEYETNMLLYMKRYKLSFSELKITTVYINENETSHFRPVRDSARIYSLIFKFFLTSGFVKFLTSSVISYALDIAVFSVLTYFLTGSSHFVATTVPYVSARLLSSLLNYTINRRLVFKDTNESVKSTAVKYYILAALILVVGSVAVTYTVKGLMTLPAVKNSFISDADKTLLNDMVKISVDALLYIVSYNVQKKYIFKAN